MKRLSIAILAVSCWLCTLLTGVLRSPVVAAQETQQVGVVIQEMPYDAARKVYVLRFSVTNPERVGMVIVRVVDSNATDVGKYPVELYMSPTAEVLIDGSGFTPGGKYTVKIQAQDRFGYSLQRPGNSSSGSLAERFILDQLEFFHKAPKGVEFSIGSVNPDFDAGLLTIDLDVPLDAAVVSYDGSVVSESGQSVLEFGPQPFTSTGIEVPLPAAMRQGEEQQEYVLTVNLTTPENVRSKATFDFTPPEPPGLGERIRDALQKNPVITLAIVSVLSVAVTLIIVFSKRKRDPLYEGGHPAPLNQPTLVGSELVQRPVKPVGLRVRVVQTPGASQVPGIILHSFPITLGREHCDVSFPGDKKVSRNHAQVTLRDGRIWLEDTGSLNGTFLGEEQLEKSVPVPLDRIAHVRLGPNTIVELEVES